MKGSLTSGDKLLHRAHMHEREHTDTHEREVEGEGVIEVRVKLVPLPSGMTSTHRWLAAKESNAPNRIHRGHRSVCQKEKRQWQSLIVRWGRKCVYPYECVSCALLPFWHVCPTGVYLLFLFIRGSTFLSSLSSASFLSPLSLHHHTHLLFFCSLGALIGMTRFPP